MKLESRTKNIRDRIMRSKSTKMQKVREFGRKKAGDSKALLILWTGITKEVFQMEGKKFKYQESLKT